jgi:two-component sensor histidine kinase
MVIFYIFISAMVFLLYLQTGAFVLWKNPVSLPARWFFVISVSLAALVIVFTLFFMSGADKSFYISRTLLIRYLLLPHMLLLPLYAVVAFGFFRQKLPSAGPAHVACRLLQDLQQMVFICNQSFQIVQSNRFSCDLLRKTPDDLVGANVADMFAEQDKMRELFDNVYKYGYSGAQKMHLSCDDHTMIPVGVSCVLLKDRYDDIYGFAVYGKDNREVIKLLQEISLREQAEVKLRAMSENLEAEVEKRTTEIRDSVEELQIKVAERVRVEEKIKMEIDEMGVMLNEIHTRVKKNISIILTILDSVAHREFGTKANFDRQRLDILSRRFNAILLVNRQVLTDNDYGMVDFKKYLEMLMMQYKKDIYNTVGAEITLEASNHLLWIDQAIPLALVANELVNNAISHAFIERIPPEPCVAVQYSKDGSRWCHFAVTDNGNGFNPEDDSKKTFLKGLQLVEMLVREQLNGSIVVNTENGVSISIRIPMDELRRGHLGIN